MFIFLGHFHFFPANYAYLDLVDVDLLVLSLHLLDAILHGRHGGLSILQGLRRVVGLFHVERLVAQRFCLLFVAV